MTAPKTEITTIFLDIGGVLLYLNIEPLLDEISQASGLSRAQLWQDRDNSAYHAFERAEITFEEYHDRVFQSPAGGYLLPLERFRELWLNVPGRPTPVVDLLPTLRRQAKVFLLTNTNTVHFPRLYSDYDFMERVDGVIASHLVGHRKPEREIYELALDRAGARAEQALFVDDMPENAAAAAGLGITAHNYTGMAALNTFLRENGFDIPV